MCHANNDEQKTNDEKKRTTESRKIRGLGEKETYMYLWIMEADTIKQLEMKVRILKNSHENEKTTWKKVYHRNQINRINTWAVPLVRCSKPFLKRMREQLQQINQRTRKLMMKHEMYHPRDDIGYRCKKNWKETEVANIEDKVDTFDTATRRLHIKEQRRNNCSNQKQHKQP